MEIWEAENVLRSAGYKRKNHTGSTNSFYKTYYYNNTDMDLNISLRVDPKLNVTMVRDEDKKKEQSLLTLEELMDFLVELRKKCEEGN